MVIYKNEDIFVMSIRTKTLKRNLFPFTYFQKEILIDINVDQPTLYRIIFRFINQNPSTVMADVTLTPDVSICKNMKLLIVVI